MLSGHLAQENEELRRIVDQLQVTIWKLNCYTVQAGAPEKHMHAN